MKVTKLVTIIAIAIMVATIAGCEETVVLELVARVDASTLAELKDEPNGDFAPILINEAKRAEILSFPNPGEEGFDEWYELVLASAVNVNVLDITNCKANPLVIRVGNEESIEIKNSGTVSHTLTCRGNSITIPAGGSRGIVVSEFTKVKTGNGTAGYACDNDLAGIFSIDPNLVLKPSEKQRYTTLRVVNDIVLSGGSPGIEGVKVTLVETGTTKETVSDGSVTFRINPPLTVRLEKEGFTAIETTVMKDGEEIVFLSNHAEVVLVSPSGEQIVSNEAIDRKVSDDLMGQLIQNRAYAREHLGIDLPPGRILVSTDQEWLDNKYFESLESSGPRGGLNKDTPVAIDELWGNPDGLDITHTWWHINVQYYLLNAHCCTNNNKMQMVGPEWLFEGSAEAWSLFVKNDFVVNIEQEMAWRRKLIPTDFNLLDMNTRLGWRESPEGRFEARDLAVYMLIKKAGWHSLVDFYQQLGEYYADEAAKVGLRTAYDPSSEAHQFRDNFFDPPERLKRLDEIFQSAFGLGMEELAEELRNSL